MTTPSTRTTFRPPVLCIGAALALATALTAAPAAHAQVGVSVTVAQPGVYGRIDIGNQPPPQVVYAQPIVVVPARVRQEPLYLYVPPGHQKKWAKHCARYDACGRPVYFVREEWVRDQARGHGDRDRNDDHGHGHGKGHKHGHR